MAVGKSPQVLTSTQARLWNEVIDGKRAIDLNSLGKDEQAVVNELGNVLYENGWTRDETSKIDANKLKSWQQWAGLTPTGTLDNKTMFALFVAKTSPARGGSGALGANLGQALAAGKPGSAPIANTTFAVGDVASAAPKPGAKALHVQWQHLDGIRPDVLEALLKSGQLPTLAFTTSRGKTSFRATTSDKSETNAVIPTIFAGVQDTFFTGWWGFNRGEDADPTAAYTFWDVWTNPRGVQKTDRGPGEKMPMLPEYYADKGVVQASGFGQMTQGIPAENVSHAYVEGAESVFTHKYIDQAHATMAGFNTVLQSMAARGEYPGFSHVVIAPADEFGHLEGALLPKDASGKYVLPQGVELDAPKDAGPGVMARATFRRRPPEGRSSDLHERIFKILEEDERGGKRLARLRGTPTRTEKKADSTIEHFAKGHFRSIERDNKGAIVAVSLDLPSLPGPSSNGTNTTHKFVSPHYALQIAVVDIELGNLINTLRNIRLDGGRVRCTQDETLGIDNYDPKAKEESLFRYTKFISYSDHGIVDTPNMYGKADEISRRYREGGPEKSYSQTLAAKLWGPGSKRAADGLPHGVLDDTNVPDIVKFSHLDESWQTPEIKQMVANARKEMGVFVARFKKLASSPDTKGALWAPLLKQVGTPAAQQKIEEALKKGKPYLDLLANTFIDTRLNNDPKNGPTYAKAAALARRQYLDKNVGLIYGGAARNNAELFLPAGSGRDRTWTRRPTFQEIMDSGVPAVLKDTDGSGLILIRKENEKTAMSGPLGEMHVAVMDRQGNEGTITINQDPATGELKYRYDAPKGRDPLGGWANGKEGTYAEWNTWSTAAVLDPKAPPAQRAFHNVIAGLGGRLYSKNPTLGDIMVIHDASWNFDTNVGGHGGSNPAEKLVFMSVSGEDIEPGELKGRGRYRVKNGKVVEDPFDATPSVFDILPTTLQLTGHTSNDFAEWGRTRFKAWMEDWLAKQPREMLAGLTPQAILKLAASMGLGSEEELQAFVADALAFMQMDTSKLPDLPRTYRPLGNPLQLGSLPDVRPPTKVNVSTIGRFLDWTKDGTYRFTVPLTEGKQLGPFKTNANQKVTVELAIQNGKIDFDPDKTRIVFTPRLDGPWIFDARGLYVSPDKRLLDRLVSKEKVDGMELRVDLRFAPDPIVTEKILGLKNLPLEPRAFFEALFSKPEGQAKDPQKEAKSSGSLTDYMDLSRLQLGFDMELTPDVSYFEAGHRFFTPPDRPTKLRAQALGHGDLSSPEASIHLELPVQVAISKGVVGSDYREALAKKLGLPDQFTLTLDVATTAKGDEIDVRHTGLMLTGADGQPLKGPDGKPLAIAARITADRKLVLKAGPATLDLTGLFVSGGRLPLRTRDLLDQIRKRFENP
jgi:hypothetical protein